MKYKLIVTARAKEEINDAFDWYQMQSEFAAAYLLERVEEAFKHLGELPMIYPSVYKNFRQIVLKPFPYVLIYKVKQAEVTVFRLWPTSRNPQNKFKEL